MWHEESCQNCGLQECSISSMTVHQLTQHYLFKSSWQSILVLLQPPYLYDLSPPDIFLFPKLKMTPEGKKLQTGEDIIMIMTDELTTIQQISFEQCFQT
jgi:hypothetical protein